MYSEADETIRSLPRHRGTNPHPNLTVTLTLILILIRTLIRTLIQYLTSPYRIRSYCSHSISLYPNPNSGLSFVTPNPKCGVIPNCGLLILLLPRLSVFALRIDSLLHIHLLRIDVVLICKLTLIVAW